MTDRPPASVSAVLILLLLNSLAWLTFAFIAAAALHPSIPEGDPIRWAMSLLALLTSGTLIGLCVFMRRRSRFAYYLTLGLLGLLALLTVADEFGFSDLIVLIITVSPFALLIKDRAWYLQRNPALQNESEPPNTSLPAKGAHRPDVLTAPRSGRDPRWPRRGETACGAAQVSGGRGMRHG
ncbi:MAG: hypothetical protein MUO23_10860 [Anaerolineales bacterium]|nr:hypothetical protein [Anaerolineales bacterium]